MPALATVPSTQMNTRIPTALKLQGDSVLERHGVTPSQAVRCLWDYLCRNDDLPDYMKEQRADTDEAEHARIATLVESGRGMAIRLAQERGILAHHDGETIPLPSYEEMEDDLYEGMLDDYHALSR